MHGDSPETCARTHHRRWRIVALINTLLVVVVLIAACSNGNGAADEDRQFATDRHTETPGVATEIPSTVPTEIPTIVATPVASPIGNVVLPVSSVHTLYAMAERGVIAIDVATGATRVICRSDKNGDVIRIASSPDGDRVAVLRKVKKDDKTRYDLEIRSSTGETITTWKDIEAHLDRVTEPGKGRSLLDWSRDGGKIAAAFPDGGAVVIPVAGGDPSVLLTRGQAPAPVSIQWSPDGMSIAFASRSAGGKGASLSLATVGTLPADPVRIAGTGGNRPIRSVEWLPDGSGVLAIQGRPNTATDVGGDVVAVDWRTLTPRTILGSSRFGPTSAIVAAAPSPDGRSTALAVVTSDGMGGWVASVWIRATDESLVRVELPHNPQVASIDWSWLGLAVTLVDPDRVRIVLSAPDGQLIPLQPIIATSPEASPIPAAMPEGSPMATPDIPPIAASPIGEASPQASPEPIGTPGATPVR
jgi:WD40 repeat protein